MGARPLHRQVVPGPGGGRGAVRFQAVGAARARGGVGGGGGSASSAGGPGGAVVPWLRGGRRPRSRPQRAGLSAAAGGSSRRRVPGARLPDRAGLVCRCPGPVRGMRGAGSGTTRPCADPRWRSLAGRAGRAAPTGDGGAGSGPGSRARLCRGGPRRQPAGRIVPRAAGRPSARGCRAHRQRRPSADCSAAFTLVRPNPVVRLIRESASVGTARLHKPSVQRLCSTSAFNVCVQRLRSMSPFDTP